MLMKYSAPSASGTVIKKTVNGADASHRGAFASGDMITFTVGVPRKLGASAVVLRIQKDGQGDVDYPLSFCSTDFVNDIYEYCLDTVALTENSGEGLFFYEFLFLRGEKTLFTSTHNNVDYSLKLHSSERFVLLIHEKDFNTPTWFHGRVMYHIFVDRFCCGDGPVGTRDDVIINSDWENGIPQFAEKNGDPLANNMFFGGNLWGIAEKLEYLKSMGVGVLYLSPIFRAYSNHKYDTGDYMEIDSMFGGKEAFEHLLRRAKEFDIRIILDGVFNHTGSDSRYFDQKESYGGHGAYTDPVSPYRDWYHFKEYPTQYETWWGIRILPKLNHRVEACRRFFTGREGVCEHYVKMGIDGWRLDVADELSDDFLDELRSTVKQASDGEAVIIGEVWENATVKIAYDHRRRYFGGKQLDSVMNYPLRNGILAYLLDGDATFLGDTLKEIYSCYPKCVCDCLMNLLGTHDTERILTVLGERSLEGEESNRVLATKRMSPEKRKAGIELLKLASLIQYTVYGVPSVFYGDEAGLEGYHDPFCRMPYPWGRESDELQEWYRKLGQLRQDYSEFFRDGDFRVLVAEGTLLAYAREKNGKRITIAVNAEDTPVCLNVEGEWIDWLSGNSYVGVLAAKSAVVLIPKS